MVKIALCVSNRIEQDELYFMLLRFGIQYDVEYSFMCYLSASEIYNSNWKTIDILILDMNLQEPGQGFDVGMQLRYIGFTGIIIILSSNDNYLKSGYLLQAFRYLEMRVLESEFHNTMMAALAELQHDAKKISIKCIDGVYFISIDDIILIESCARHRLIYSTSNGYETTVSLVDIYKKLPSKEFYMPQRSVIINMRHIKRATCHQLEMCNGKQINISRRKIKDCNQILFQSRVDSYKWHSFRI